MRMAVTGLVGVVALGTLLGCGREFEPYWRVDKLRLMGIKADPVVAKQGEAVTLSALVYAPGESEVRYSWSWCPVGVDAQNGYECPIDGEDLGFPLDFELGSEETATFTNPFSEEEVKEFCEAIARAVIEESGDPELAGQLLGSDCEEGYQVSIRLAVETDEEEIISSKRLVLWAGAEQYNENPELVDFQIRPEEPAELGRLIEEAGWEVEADAGHDEMWVSVGAEESLSIVPEVAFEIRALLNPESVQVFDRTRPTTGEVEEKEESFVFRYFTTAGAFGRSRQLYAPEFQELEDAPITTYRVSEEQLAEQCTEVVDEGCVTRVFAVVRDGGLGVDWLERSFLVVQ